MTKLQPTKARKTWHQTLGEMAGYAAALWPGLLLAGLILRPDNSMLILLSGAASAIAVVLLTRFALMRIEGWRPTLRWMFPANWITGAAVSARRSRPGRHGR